MSILSKLNAIIEARNTIRTKLVNAGQALATDKLSDLASKLNLSHSTTYTPSANTSSNDMGSYHSYRYVDTSGMVTGSDATATPDEVLKTKTFYKNGYQTGTAAALGENNKIIFNSDTFLFLNGMRDSSEAYQSPFVRAITMNTSRILPNSLSVQFVMPFVGVMAFMRSINNSSGTASVTRTGTSGFNTMVATVDTSSSNKYEYTFNRKCYISGIVYSGNENGIRHRVEYTPSGGSVVYPFNSVSKVNSIFSLTKEVNDSDNGDGNIKPNKKNLMNVGDKLGFYVASSGTSSTFSYVIFIAPYSNCDNTITRREIHVPININ